MNWEAIGAVSETLGAMAVFVSIVVLIAQVRSNTKAIQAAAVMDLESQVAKSWHDAAQNPYTTGVFDRLYEGRELSGEDEGRLRATWHGVFHNLQNGFYQIQYGFLNDDYPLEVHIVNVLKFTQGRRFWDGAEETFSPEFRRYVDEVREELDAKMSVSVEANAATNRT